MNTSLVGVLSQNWWLVLLRGLAAIAFGVLAFLWPLLTLSVLIIMLGAYAFADGVFALVAAFRGGSGVPRGWLILIGILGLAGAFAAFTVPGLTALVVVTFVAWWSIVRGIFEIVGAIHLRKEIEGEWLLILSGVISILFGAFILFRPGAGALALVWIFAWYAIAFGALLVSLAIRLRRHRAALGSVTPLAGRSHAA